MNNPEKVAVMHRITINGEVHYFRDFYWIGPRDQAWKDAMDLAKKFGCLAFDTVEMSGGDDGYITYYDREDKHMDECKSILCINEKNELFPDIQDVGDHGLIFLYHGDHVKVETDYVTRE